MSLLLLEIERIGLRARTLSLLRQQSIKQSIYEVIIVANGCTDHTKTVLATFSSHGAVLPIFLERAGKSAALNCGMQAANGELLAFTDDDVDVSTGWLAELWRAFRTYDGAAGFCGRSSQSTPK